MTPKNNNDGAVMTFESLRANATLTYEVADGTDTIVGVDRMKYIYHLDRAFAAFCSLNLIYDSARYADLDIVLPLGPEWFDSITEPDPAVPLDGLLTYTTQPQIADATAIFEGESTWTVIDTPGSQPSEIFDDAFNTIASSRTTAFVASAPESATLALMFAGLLMLLRRPVKRRPVLSLPFARARRIASPAASLYLPYLPIYLPLTGRYQAGQRKVRSKGTDKWIDRLLEKCHGPSISLTSSCQTS